MSSGWLVCSVQHTNWESQTQNNPEQFNILSSFLIWLVGSDWPSVGSLSYWDRPVVEAVIIITDPSSLTLTYLSVTFQRLDNFPSRY